MAEGSATPAEEALVLVHRNPRRAIELAGRIEADGSSDVERATARWAAGLAHRELGDLAAAIAEMEWARALAAPTDPALASRITSSLALARAYGGEIPVALALLEDAERTAAGADLGRVRTQRGTVLYWHGHFEAAQLAYDAAFAVLDGSDDELGLARLHVNYGALLSYTGGYPSAVEHLTEAIELARRLDQTMIAASAEQNLGHVHSLTGDLPRSFAAYARAGELYEQADVDTDYVDMLHLDHARTLAQVNLLDEADALVRSTLRRTDTDGGSRTLAEARYLEAQIALARGDLVSAGEAARSSSEVFRAAGRTAWAVLADGLAISAEVLRDPRPEVADDAAGAAQVLDALGYRGEAARGLIVAARGHARAGQVEPAERLLALIGRRRAPLAALERVAVAGVAAHCAEQRGDRRLARRRVRAGLRIFVEDAESIGAIELRARAAANGDDLAAIGARLAVGDRRPRELLDVLEATRGSTLSLWGAQPPEDPQLAAELTALRAVVDELRSAEPGTARRALEHRRVDVERRVRDRARHVRGRRAATPMGVREAVDRLGGHVLLVYSEVDGRLYAVSVIAGRAELHDLPAVEGLRDDLDACSFALHRLNRRQGSASSQEAAFHTLRTLAGELEDHLMPTRVRRNDGPLVIVPTGALHGLAWGVFPALRARPLSVVPSLVAWALARESSGERAASAGDDGAVLLTAGPGLPGAPAEVTALAQIYPEPTVLTESAATAGAVTAGLATAHLAHLACHGAFRADNAMFSTLTLADGQLTVYDLERCASLPATVVLSACDAATSTVLRGGALLGLASALLTFGVSSVIAPLTPVNDERVVDVMIALHRALRAGQPPAAALASARGEELDPTAAAFVAIGA